MRRFLLGAAVAGLLATPALAHRGHSTLSVVELDPAAGTVVVTHRMAAHDVEPALVDIAPRAQPSLDDADALAALESYAGRAFLLEADGARVTLVHSRTELQGDDIRLIYTGRLKGPAKAIVVDSGLFEETHLDQENQVNVRRARITKTAVFHNGEGPQSLTFD